MNRTTNSLAEIFNELSAIATGLGLICFVAFPLVIPFIALTIVFAAPLIVVPALLGAVVTPPLAALGWLTRKLWGPRFMRAYSSIAIDSASLASTHVPKSCVPQRVGPGPRNDELPRSRVVADRPT